jgi:hypothetical protein
MNSYSMISAAGTSEIQQHPGQAWHGCGADGADTADTAADAVFQ